MTAQDSNSATDRTISDAARRWRETGWSLAEGLLPRDTVAEALAELQRCEIREVPGPTRRAERATRRRRLSPDGTPEPAEGPRFRSGQFDGTTLFPLPGCPTLNRLFVHPELVRFAAEALGTDDLRIYQSRVWSKRGDGVDYAQPMHSDGNHSLIPIVNRPGWWHLECFVYLHDVDEDSGAPMLVPGDVARAEMTDRQPVGPDVAPELYEAEVRATGAAGSVLAYRSDVWHRGTGLAPEAERHVLVVAFRPASAPWIGFDSHAPLVSHPDFVAFAESCTPAELALFGVPAPGHEYWNEPGVLEAMAAIYPKLDLQPWRAAAGRP